MKNFLKFIILLIISLNLTIGINERIIQADDSISTIQELDRLQKIKEKGALSVLSPDTQPYSYKDPRLGTFSGIDADIIKEIAKRLGAKDVNVKYISFSYIIEELVKNPGSDLVAIGTYMTDERKKLVNFTDPIYTDIDAILIRKDSPIVTKSDLKNKIVGVIGGTVYESLAQKWKEQGLISDYMKFFDNNSLQISLQNKLVDAIITDSMIAQNILLEKSNLNFKVLSPSQYKSELNFKVGYPLKKEDITLLNAINEKIQEMKADGTLYEILARYGVTSNYIP